MPFPFALPWNRLLKVTWCPRFLTSIRFGMIWCLTFFSPFHAVLLTYEGLVIWHSFVCVVLLFPLQTDQQPDFDETHGVLNYEEEAEQDVDIELNDDEPAFLQGQTHASVNLSPIRGTSVCLWY